MEIATKQNRKELILKAAQNLFTKFGLAKTTIEDIARRARMGKASIYYYFKSKEAIYQEVIDKEGRELRATIIDAVNKENTPQRKIRTYVVTRMTALKELANYYTAFRDEYLEQYAFIEKARREYNQFEKSMISSLLKAGVDSGVFEIKDIDLTAEAVLAALKGLEFHWTIHVPLKTIEKNVDTLMGILFKGIEKRA